MYEMSAISHGTVILIFYTKTFLLSCFFLYFFLAFKYFPEFVLYLHVLYPVSFDGNFKINNTDFFSRINTKQLELMLRDSPKVRVSNQS